MKDEELLNELIAQNSWWEDGKIELPNDVIERTIFSKLKKELNEKQVIALVGLRSVGKTTLMHSLIQSLLASKTDPKNILYFSLDGLKKEEKIIRRILTLYLHYILKKPINELKTTMYVFFDEIQKITEWGEEIKSYYDKNLKIKFVVSGSSSMNILKGSGESLVGRIIVHKIYPFSFREFLRYNHLEIEKIDLWNPTYPLKAEKITILFEEYLKIGGFPLLYNTSEDRRKQLLKSMIDLTFYRDIVNIFDVKRTDVLEGMFYIFTKESGNIINYTNLSNSLKTKFETIKSYIEYLNASFIISTSPFYSRSKVKGVEKNEKVYIADHAFGILQEVELGNKIETIVYNTLKTIDFDIFYWQDEKKNEVDIIAIDNVDKCPIAIEVKYQSKIFDCDSKGLRLFLEKHKIKKAILVTKDLFEVKKQKNEEIYCIPVWLFLLSL
ncbi:MAG: ATP-binding protein [Candidatus Micrarchaeota archaeon]